MTSTMTRLTRPRTRLLQSLPLWLAFATLGCGQKLMPTPNLYTGSTGDCLDSVPSQYQSSTVDIVYATDRAPKAGHDGASSYGTDRSNSLAFGLCTVEIGRNLSWQDLLKESRSQNHFRDLSLTFQGARELGRFPDSPAPVVRVNGHLEDEPTAAEKISAATKDLCGLMAQRLSGDNAKKEAYVLIHGFNNSMEDAAFVITGLWHFLGRQGVPIIYTWPAGVGYAYDRESGATVGHSDIDYATLAVQHLGSIYEGLLELQPCLAGEPLVEVVRGNNATFEPAAKVATPTAQARRIPTDGVYLATDRGERKASGSYYTPKYIVDYIVEHTIDPLVVEAAGKVAALRPEVEQRAVELEQKRRSIPEFDPATRRQLAVQIEAQRARLLEPYLSLKVLDPAMGSGHFLVGAADFLSLAMATDPNLPALAAMGDEDPQIFFKRMVVERCLYGVDLNPLAVELAKLSLWLHTVSSDKALSFLDHHLRCGNSLIGARLMEDLSTEPPRLKGGKVVRDNRDQMTFAFTETLRGKHLSYFLDTFRQIAEAPAGDARAERAKAKWYDEMDRKRDRFRRAADLWLAPYFGVEVTPEEYGRAVEALAGTTLERDGVEVDPFANLIDEAWFTAAHKVGTEKCFFHWELEFPEAFLGPNGPLPEAERGFDAVIGNPPYVHIRTGQIPAADAAALKNRFRSAHGQWDLFALMTERALGSLRAAGRWGFIMPRRGLANENFEPLRRLLTVENSLEAVADAGRVFDDAAVECVIAIARRDPPTDADAVRFDDAANGRSVGELPLTALASLPFRIVPTSAGAGEVALAARLTQLGTPLGGLVSIVRGIESGLNDERIGQTGLGRPLVTGDDVQRHSLGYSGWNVRPDDSNPAKYKTPAVYEPPKLLIRFVAPGLIAACDTVGYYNTNSLYNVHSQLDPFCLCALLNSALLNWWFRLAFQADEDLFPHVQKSQLGHIPVCLERTGAGDDRPLPEPNGALQRLVAAAIAELTEGV